MWFWSLLIGGLAVVIFVSVDILWSTISTKGGGPLTMAVTTGCWKVARVSFRFVIRRHRVLESSALVTMVVTFLVWVAGIWLGWTMVFSADAQLVIYQMTDEPAVWTDRFYFAGMVLLTLGTGDVVAGGSGWRMLSMVASFNGLVVITLTITYLMSVISAAIEKRKLALSIDALGGSAREILKSGWDGSGFGALDDKLQLIADDLMMHAERHLAYPVLQFFHPKNPWASLPVSVAKLDDLTTLMSRCLTDDTRYNRTTVRALRRAVDLYIRRIRLSHVSDVDRPPPMPDFEALRGRGMKLRSYRTCREAFAKRTDMRSTLMGLVESEGWDWPE